jgi:hypothetical protein
VIAPGAAGAVLTVTVLTDGAPLPQANTGVTVKVDSPAPLGNVTLIEVDPLLPIALPKLQI